MLRFEVTSADLLRSRFAVSPAFELQSLLRVLNPAVRTNTPPARTNRLRPVVDRMRRDDDAFAALLALQHPRGGPSFVVPPPTRGMHQSIEDDLRAIRAAPRTVVRAEIDACLAARPTSDRRVRAVLDAPEAVDLLADAFARAWTALLAADWPQLRAICERDIVNRSGELARHGWAAALRGLHPRVRWRDGGIEVSRIRHAPVALRGQGMMFIPSVFVWPNVAAHADDPWPRCLIYPARGVGQWWSAAEPAPASAALEELIGRTRARILMALHEPASTTQLARSLGLPTGSVGDHLRTLARAGLLDPARSGRSVLYRRTPLGDLLATGSPPATPESSQPERNRPERHRPERHRPEGPEPQARSTAPHRP